LKDNRITKLFDIEHFKMRRGEETRPELNPEKRIKIVTRSSLRGG